MRLLTQQTFSFPFSFSKSSFVLAPFFPSSSISLPIPIIGFFKSPALHPPSKRNLLPQIDKRRLSPLLAPNIHLLPFDSDSELLNLQKKFTDSINQDLPIQSDSEGLVREIVRIAANSPGNANMGQLLGAYEGRISEKQCLEVLEMMSNQGSVSSCLYFFEWMELQDPSLATPRTCSLMFYVLGRAGIGDKLMLILRNLSRSAEFRDVNVYNAAIYGVLCAKSYEDAWKVYEVMVTENIQPDHATCSLMITIIRKNGGTAKDAWDFFQTMEMKGVECNADVLDAIVKSFCNEGLMKEALIIISEMERKGFPLSTNVYHTLMNAYSKLNQIEEVEGLFLEIKERGLMPTVDTFNALLDAYRRRMQPEIVEKLLLDMHDSGLAPNSKSYSCLISAYGMQKKGDMAEDAFTRMKNLGIKPTSHCYAALIHAFSINGCPEKAYTAFEEMQREGMKLSVETYTALLDAFRHAGDNQTLLKIWKLMISERVEGTTEVFNILLDAFAKQGQFIEARDVFCEFGKIGLHPTLVTYNMLMHAYAKGGQESNLPQLLKEMSTFNLKPDSVTYSTMIYAYARIGDFKRAFFYHKKMIKNGQIPNVKSYEKLRAALDVKAAKTNKKDRSAILGILSSKKGKLLNLKKKRKKDEFWKGKKKFHKTSEVDCNDPR